MMKFIIGKVYLTNISLLLFVCLLYFFSSPGNEFWWSDESRHAMDGVFFYDFFNDLPFINLRSYIEEYIVRFPAISFTWNLPFFAVISAPFYSLFGISVATAQCVVLSFACVLAISMNSWAKEFFSPTVAIITVILFFLNIHVLLWMRSVMLEIPALSMALLTLLACNKFIQNTNYRQASILGITGFSMLMTKQITLFILPILIFYLWNKKHAFILWDKHAWPVYLFFILGVSGIVIHALTIGVSGYSGVSNTYSNLINLMIFERIPLIFKAIYGFFPLPIIIFSFVGVVSGIYLTNKRKIFFLVSWITIGILFLAFITKSPGNAARYCIYIAPPIYLLAISVLDLIRIHTVQYNLFCTIIAGLIIWNFQNALQQKTPYVKGYEQIAEYVYQLPEKRPVLFCCDHDGNFIFSMRALDKNRQTITLRADKLLVSIVISPLRGVTSHVKNSQQVTKILNDYGVKYLVIEDDTYSQVKEFELLRKVVSSDQFEKLKTFSIKAGDGSYPRSVKATDINVSIYRYINAKPIKNGVISIPLPRYKRSVVLKLY